MCPQAGLYTKADADADIAAHAGLATVHQDAPALIATHKGDASAHHTKYLDAEAQAVADALIAIHAALATVHQDAPALIATHAGLATVHQDAPALIATHAAIATVHHTPPGLPIEKTADEVVNNSIVYQDDDHLFFAIGANEIWLITLLFIGQATSTGDLKFNFQFTVPAGAVMYGWKWYKTTGGASGYAPIASAAGAITNVSALSTVSCLASGWAIVVNNSNAGTVQMQWCQRTATEDDTTLKKGSYIIPQKIG